MGNDQIAPLLIVEDILAGKRGLVLLPAVPRAGLHLGPGDFVDVMHDGVRDEIEILGLEADHDPARVRLRVSSSVPIGPGCEVWRSQGQSHVALKRPARPPGQIEVSLSGALRVK